MEDLTYAVTIAVLAFIQNTSFSIVSRARNRNVMSYHATASVFSNLVWFMTMKYLIVTQLALIMLPGYVIGTVLGSLFGARIAQMIERTLMASTDDHLKG